MGYISIKTWIDGCYSNYKKFKAYAQCSVSDGFKQKQKEVKKVMREHSQSVDIIIKSGRQTQAPAKYLG
jgi:hypothetical protein